jgi:hypothetical protein
MFQNLTIKQKLVSGFGSIAALSLIAALCAFYSLSSVSGMAVKLTHVDAVKMYNAGKIDTAAAGMVAQEYALLVHAQAKDAAGVAAQADAFHANALVVRRCIGVVQPLLVTPDGKLMVANTLAASTGVEDAFIAFKAAIDAGDLPKASALLDASIPRLNKLSTLGNDMLERQRTRMANFAAEMTILITRANALQIAPCASTSRSSAREPTRSNPPPPRPPPPATSSPSRPRSRPRRSRKPPPPPSKFTPWPPATSSTPSPPPAS